MRLLGTALWCAVVTVTLPGCFATLRAGYPMGHPGDEYTAPYNYEVIAGINVEAANFLRFAGGYSNYNAKGDFKGKNAAGTTDDGSLAIATLAQYAEVDVTLKNWYRPPENEVCDYERGFRARASGFFASGGPVPTDKVKESGAFAFTPKNKTDVTRSNLNGLTQIGGTVEIGGFDNRGNTSAGQRWFAGGGWIGAGASMMSASSEKYGDYTAIIPHAQLTLQWMPLGFGAFFPPSSKVRGVVRYKIAEVFHCEEYYPDQNSQEFKDCQQKLEKYRQKASRQRAVEIAENRCT